ncbi:MAG: hypothetical protein EZS28_038618 [Streblomastix strix]|uniref:Uncharacterized protein n=1 Tax=Streblomastix strix TaxID=222440 RepID=A0A5J4U4Z1_9EUKA|nr:MAG: hypothetical protein EZS28_038618 [Streblomastix strix]
MIKWNLRIQNGYNGRFEATQFGSVQTDFMICADTPESSLILRFYMKVCEQVEVKQDVPDNFDQNPLGLTIGLSNESGSANRGLRISADGNTLSFNGSVIAGTGATSGASNCSVNYSAGNPILWGLNSVDTNVGFYSDGPKVYWRAKPVTLGAVPP